MSLKGLPEIRFVDFDKETGVISLMKSRNWAACTIILRRLFCWVLAGVGSEWTIYLREKCEADCWNRSCLLHRFVKDEWRILSSQTIGVEFASKIIRVGTGARRKRIKLQVWTDIMGNKKPHLHA